MTILLKSIYILIFTSESIRSDLYLSPCTKNLLQINQNLNVKPETPTLLEENRKDHVI